MPVNTFSASIKNCGVGILTDETSEVNLHSLEIIDCTVGIATLSKPGDIDRLLSILRENASEIDSLIKQVESAPPEKRKDVISASSIFSALSVVANGSTVLQFIIDAIPSIRELMK